MTSKSLFQKSQQSGLTLIELLVVLAIIGLLVTVVSAVFSESRAQTRDKIRMTSLKELQLAVEQYKAQNGVYPLRGCTVTDTTPTPQWTSPGTGDGDYYNECAQYIVGLVPDYIPALPTDPNAEDDNNNGFLYWVSNDQSTYKIMVHRSVETLQVGSFKDAFARCPAASVGACPDVAAIDDIYAVYSPGAEFR